MILCTYGKGRWEGFYYNQLFLTPDALFFSYVSLLTPFARLMNSGYFEVSDTDHGHGHGQNG